MSFSANAQKFYIDGQWVDPVGATTQGVINPATEAPFMTIALGGKGDVDRAVQVNHGRFFTLLESDSHIRLPCALRLSFAASGDGEKRQPGLHGP